MQISKVTRLSNPRGRRASSRKRRNPKRLSLKQKLHFGSARQRAAAKAALRGKRKNPKRRAVTKRTVRRRTVKAAPKRRRRRANPAHMITLGLVNPRPSTGKPKRRKKSNMARTKKRRTTRRRRASANPRRRRRNSVRVIVRRSRRRATSNPQRRRRASANPRRRRINVRRRHSTGRRRNPMIFGQSVSALGMAKIVAAGLAGVAITKAVPNMLPAGMLPASPFTASLVSLAVAVGAGMLVSSLVKGDPMVGYAVGFGGMMQAGSVMLNAFLPQVGSMIGLQGLGDLVPGRFPIPQNPIMAGSQMMLSAPMPAGPAHAAAGVGAIFNPFGRAM